MAKREDVLDTPSSADEVAEEAGTPVEVGLIFITTIALVLGIVVGLLELKNYGAGMLS